MNLHNAYRSVYDKSQVSTIDGVWVVHEQEPQATFHTLRIAGIRQPSFALDKSEYKNTHNKIFGKSSTLKDEDCDGFAVVTYNGKNYIVAVELKSAFDTNKILKAYEQAAFSFLKNHMTFSLCNGYDIGNFDVLIVIACCSPKEEQCTWMKSQMMLEMDKTHRTPNAVHLAVKLFYEGMISLSMGDVHFISNLDLPEQIKNCQARVVLKCPSSPLDQELSVEFRELVS